MTFFKHVKQPCDYQRGKWRLPVKTNIGALLQHLFSGNFILWKQIPNGTIILSFLGIHKQLSKNLNVFFSFLVVVAADTCKNKRNGPEISLIVLIFGHIYCSE